ncbi:MAG TPA: sugar-binding protein [Verrucomicrobiae bacterium]|nr:sugar-binding protein [Verrucomicrobiae bacterium]
MKIPSLVALVACASCARALADEPAVGIPFKPDPPPAVDGQLEEWTSVPGALVLNRAEQATWGSAHWKSPDDLSAKVWLAWRQDMLYLAADVADDKIRQTERGAGIWKGDCVQLYLDLAPDDEIGRKHFGKGQLQIVFSPGNFRRGGDSLTDCPPESYCVKPSALELRGALVAAQQTGHGYTLEAAIPWATLGVGRPVAGMPANFEIAVFDTDGTEPRPEKLLSFSTKPWAMTRPRMSSAVLAGADGKPPAVFRGATVFEKVELKPGQRETFRFTAAKPTDGKEAVLVLKARMDTPKVGGYTQALRLTLGGTALDGKRLMNKPLEAKGEDGRLHRLAAADRFTTYYAPDFTSADSSRYAIRGVKTGEFELRVTDLLREGENQLVIQNACGDKVTRSLVAADCRLVLTAPPPPPKPKAGPPTGAIPVCAPAKEPRGDFGVRELPDAAIETEIAGEKITVASRFSTPAGKWERGSNPFFAHSRQIDRRDEATVVRDTFRNLTEENLPLMQRHEIAISSPFPIKRIWLAGLSPAGLTGTSSDGANPTTFGMTGKTGVGLLPLNDEFQVHVTNYAADGALGLADNQFVLRPGQTYIAEWAIVPVARPDYFDFVNAARRLVDANFTIPYCFAFLRAGALTDKWSDEQFAEFIRLKSADLVCAGLSSLRYQGHYPQGIAFQLVQHDSYRRYVERVHRLAPAAKTSIYFHCYIDSEENAAAKFPDARVLRSDGSHADYGQPFYGIFFPTEGNAYGRAIRRNVDIILDDIKADGVYWDELEYSAYAYHYGEPWDGCSADIDATTMKIRRLKSSVTLLSQPWRVALIKEIMARGPFIANGQPRTRTVARLKFPRFVETGNISNCARAQLHSPIALGDHLTERCEEDAYRNMVAALDYGCVSHWYSDVQVMPAYETITKYMYPITPIELHEGYIIAKERILTNRSGLFGWGDASKHEVHVFDDTGREVADFKAPIVERDGATFTELRIGEGWSAAIVRR